MTKSLFEQLGGTYHEENGYLIPDLKLPKEEEQPIGIWGQRHAEYLKQYNKVTYTNLLTSGRLSTYLTKIDEQAHEQFERLMEDMKQAQGITEELKTENSLEWTGRMNNIRNCVMEIINSEIVL
ncbi:TnpV protein [Lachnospiraceae bacterium]|nr:TnpV protein [Lachnospiraceae bacterium]